MHALAGPECAIMRTDAACVYIATRARPNCSLDIHSPAGKSAEPTGEYECKY